MSLAEFVFLMAELLGTIAFAVSGAMVALERRLDLFGVVFLAGTTALGGGILRDVLLGRFPPRMFYSPEYLLIATGSAVFVFIIADDAKERYQSGKPLIETINNLFDAVGLGAFTVVGVQASVDAGYGDNAFMSIFLGMLTGIGGGLLRDMMSRQTPFVFKKDIYALASIAGGTTYWLLQQLTPQTTTLCMFSGIGVTFTIRLLATRYRWNLPRLK